MVRQSPIILLCLLFTSLLPHSYAQCPTCSVDAGLSGCTLTLTDTVTNPTYTLSSSSDKLCIASGAVIQGSWNISMTDPDAMIVNNGRIEISSDLEIEEGTFINNGIIDIPGDLIISSGQISSFGFIGLGGDLHVDSTAAEVCNQDSMNITNDALIEGDLMNNGNLVVGSDFLQSSGDICVTSVGKVYATNFQTNSNFRGPSPGSGCAYFEVDNYSEVNSSGIMTGAIDFCDQTPPMSSPFLDSFSGVIDSNVTYCGCLSTLSFSVGFEKTEIEEEGAYYRISSIFSLYPGNYEVSVEVKRRGQDFIQVGRDLLEQKRRSMRSWDLALPRAAFSQAEAWRLKVTDIDGAIAYSPAFEYKKGEELAWWFSSDNKKLFLFLQSPAICRLALIDMRGQEVWRSEMGIETENMSIALPDYLPLGVYQIQIQANGKTERDRIWLR